MPILRSVSLRPTERLILLMMLVICLGLRAVIWPGIHELRDGDELAYAGGSLQLLEGNLPGIHYAPAGPQTWIGWASATVATIRHFIFPNPNERRAGITIRPFLAVQHTVFDSYRDMGFLRQVWVVTSVAAVVAGVVAAFFLGLARGGLPGAIFLSGSFTVIPLFLEFSVQARPYAFAWSAGVVALYYALASPRKEALLISAVVMGFAIGSRIDMGILLPVVLSEIWIRHRTRFVRECAKYCGVLLIAFLVVAPWYLMTLVGSLRAVGTIRSGIGLTTSDPVAVLNQLCWNQGMVIQLLLFLAGLIFLITRRPRRILLACYLCVILVSVFKGSAFGLRYQGGPLLLLLVAGLPALEFIRNYSVVSGVAIACLSLVLPAVRSAQLVANVRHDYVEDSATAWVEHHVPAGTIVYLRPWITNPLPTSAAADTTWSEVASVDAYRKKFESGSKRFSVDVAEIPRALSEVNLALERANRRCFFILGGCDWVAAPRYDVRVFQSGPVFGIRDLPTVFGQTGGVVVVRSSREDPLVQQLGKPDVAWLNSGGDGTRIYCSADVQGRLR